jgi:hypothetical protein
MHGYFLADNLNILNPNLRFECATLSCDIPSCIPIGHISLVADGPSGCYFI